MAGELALGPPELAVDVENAEAEKVAEDLSEGLALGEVVEVSLEYVLHVLGVSSDDGATGTEAADDDGVGGGVSKKISVPVEETAAIGVEGEQAADDRVGWGAMAGVSVPASGLSAQEDEDEEIEEEEEEERYHGEWLWHWKQRHGS